MQSTMFYLSKGGVGKTTTSVLYAWYLRLKEKKVLFVDFDMQGNSTNVLMNADIGRFEKYRANPIANIADFASDKFDEIIGTKSQSDFDIVTSLDDVRFDESDCQNIMNSVNWLIEQNKYDIVIFDTTPSLDTQLVALLQSVDNFVIPMKPEDFAFDQVNVVINQYVNYANENRATPINISGIIMNGFMKRSAAMVQIAELTKRGFGDYLLEPFLDFSEPIRESMDNSIPIFGNQASWARRKSKIIAEIFDQIIERSVWPK